ncbi:unnamed protein product [Camellia sinensis]
MVGSSTAIGDHSRNALHNGKFSVLHPQSRSRPTEARRQRCVGRRYGETGQEAHREVCFVPKLVPTSVPMAATRIENELPFNAIKLNSTTRLVVTQVYPKLALRNAKGWDRSTQLSLSLFFSSGRDGRGKDCPTWCCRDGFSDQIWIMPVPALIQFVDRLNGNSFSMDS